MRNGGKEKRKEKNEKSEERGRARRLMARARKLKIKNEKLKMRKRGKRDWGKCVSGLPGTGREKKCCLMNFFCNWGGK